MAFRSKIPSTTCLVCYKEMTQFECNISLKSAHVSICHQSFVKLLGLPVTFITEFLKETRLCPQCQEWMVQILGILDELKFVQEKVTSAKKKAISLITYSYLRQKQKENADKLITIADKCDKTREARKRIFDRLGQLGIIRNANNMENNDIKTAGVQNQNKKLPNMPQKFAFKLSMSIGVQTDSFGPNNMTHSSPVLQQQKQPQFQQQSPQELLQQPLQQPKQPQQPIFQQSPQLLQQPQPLQQQKPLELPQQQPQLLLQNKNKTNINPTPNKRPARRTYPCPNCSDKIYQTRQGLTLHLNRHHPKPKSKTPPPNFDEISSDGDGESSTEAEIKRESPLMSPEQVEKLEKQKVDQYLENYLSNKMRAQPSPPPPQQQPTILQQHHNQQQQQQQPIMNKSSSFQNEFQMFFNPPLQFPSNCSNQQSPNLISPIGHQQQQQAKIWPKKQIIANVDAEISRKRKEFEPPAPDDFVQEIFTPKNLNTNYGTNVTNTNINQIQSNKQVLSESPSPRIQNVIIQNNYNNTTDGSQYQHQQPAIYNSNQIINYPSSISSGHSNSSTTSHNQYNLIPPVYQQHQHQQQQQQEIAATQSQFQHANPMISGQQQQQEPQIFNNTSNYIFPEYSTPNNKPSTSPRISLFNNTFNSLVQQHTSMIHQSGQQQQHQQNFNHLQPISQIYANPAQTTHTQYSSLQQQQFYHNQNRY